MSSRNCITVDGNEAAASVAFRVSEVIAIFPITPSSPMAEVCDEWASRGKTNLWGVIPDEMQQQMVEKRIRFFTIDAYALAKQAGMGGRTKASLAITGGVHSGLDVVKATMVGAHVTQMVSALLKHGPRRLRKVLYEVETFMEENEWGSLDEMRGNMGFGRIPDPAAYERATFRMMLR
jgi:hypothetical protein